MTRLGRIALLLLTTCLVAVSVSLWITQQILTATRVQLSATQEENNRLSIRLQNIENGITIPKATRQTIRRMQEQGTSLAP